MKRITIKNNNQDVLEAIQLIEANYPELKVNGFVCEGTTLTMEADAQPDAQPDKKQIGFMQKLFAGLLGFLNKITDVNVLIKTLRFIITLDLGSAIQQIMGLKKEQEDKEKAVQAGNAGEEPTVAESITNYKSARNAAIILIESHNGIITKNEVAIALMEQFPDASRNDITKAINDSFQMWGISNPADRIDEGLWDRFKAKTQGYLGAAGAVAKNVGNKLSGDPNAQKQSIMGAMQTGKFGQLIKQYIDKIQNHIAKVQKYANSTQDQEERKKADEMVKQMTEFVRAASDALKQEQEELKKAGYDRKQAAQGNNGKEGDGNNNSDDKGKEKKDGDNKDAGKDNPDNDSGDKKNSSDGDKKNASDDKEKKDAEDKDKGEDTGEDNKEGDDKPPTSENTVMTMEELTKLIGNDIKQKVDDLDGKLAYHITDIEWDSEDEDFYNADDVDYSNLPTETYILTENYMDQDDIAVWLHERGGVCPSSFQYNEVDPRTVDEGFLGDMAKAIGGNIKKGVQNAWNTAKGAAGELNDKLKDRAGNFAAGKGFTATVDTATLAKDLSEIIGEMEADLKDCGWSEKQNPQLAKVINGLETTMNQIHGQGEKGTMSNIAKIRHGAGKLAGSVIVGAAQGAVLGAFTGWMKKFMSPRAHAALVAAAVVLLRAVLRNIQNMDVELDKAEEEEAKKAIATVAPNSGDPKPVTEALTEEDDWGPLF